MLINCRLQRVEKESMHLHHYLRDNDACFYIGEYTSHKGFDYSDMNQFIENFKKNQVKKILDPWSIATNL